MNRVFTILSFLLAGVLFSNTSVGQNQPRDTNTKRTNLGVTRLYVNSPAAVAGLKRITVATWGGTGNPSILNTPIVRGLDSLALSPLTNNTAVNGNICLLYRGGGVTFAQKVQYAVNAGARAVIIVNNIAGDPIGMSNTGTVTYNIPIMMVSDVDGNAINDILRNGGTVNATISDWSLNLAHDLGFVRGYQSLPHAMSIPLNQLSKGANRLPYRNLIGGAVANFGTNNETNVTVLDTVTWNPQSGSVTTVHTGSYSIANINSADSMRFGFGASSSNWTLPSPNGTGYYRYKYSINYSLNDDEPLNNVYSFDQQVTDSIFCKGTYSTTTNQPVATVSFRPAAASVTTYSWGPMYYLADGKYYARKMQYFISTSAANLTGEESIGLVFKWTDGSNAQPLDSFVEGDELILVGIGRKAYTAADTVGSTTINLATPSTNRAVVVDSNSWYWTSVQVTQGSNSLFIGCDENASYFTRMYLQDNQNSFNEMSNLIHTTDYSTLSGSSTALVTLPFGGHGYDIDSSFYSNLYYIPNIALHLSKNKVGVSVENAKTKTIGEIKVSPVPASSHINVDVKLNAAYGKMAYRLVDLKGSIVYKIDRENGLSDSFSIPCNELPSGIYYLAAFTESGLNAVEKVIIQH